MAFDFLTIVNFASITVICVLLSALALFIFSSLWNKEKKFPVIVYFICVFVSLFFLNWLGYYSDSESTSWVFRIGTAMGITMTMFGNEYDGAHATILAESSFLYGTAMTLCYFGALSCTVLIIIQIFFKDIKNSARILINARGISGRTIIIAGIGNAVELLLQSLNEKEKRNVTIILDNEDSVLKKEYLNKGIAVIASELDEASLTKAGLYNGRENIFISLLSDDVRNLTAARVVIAAIHKEIDINFKAYIQYTSIDRAEHFKFSEKAKGAIIFFNPHEKTARSVLSRWPVSNLIPKGFIDTAVARMRKTYHISHIFVGFGKTNIQILKKSLIIDQLPQCDYRALVIDSDINNQAAIFRNSCRGLFRESYTTTDAAKFLPLPEEKCDIEFTSMNVLSREFFERIIAEITANDFTVTVVSLGDDKLSVETAMEIRQWAYENDIPAEKLRLFINVHKHSAISAEDVLNPESSSNENIIVIEPFGFEEDVFYFSTIIDEDADMLAIHIAENYSGGGSDSRWKFLNNYERDSNRCAALSIRSKLNMMGFDLEFDKDTEQDPAIIAEFEAAYANREIQDNIARLEHQRWNVYYLVSGWLPLPKAEITAESHKNHRKRKHACITTFEGLEELARIRGDLASKDFSDFDTRLYDYDLMNNLLGNIRNTKYKIKKDIDTNVYNKR
jgi:hypothetical protein